MRRKLAAAIAQDHEIVKRWPGLCGVEVIKRLAPLPPKLVDHGVAR